MPRRPERALLTRIVAALAGALSLGSSSMIVP
jgi:hypothetical protein